MSSWSRRARAARHRNERQAGGDGGAPPTTRPSSAHLELDWQRRRREEALEQGATLVDPESVWFSYDTKLGRDLTIEPHVVFGPGVTIEDFATIRAFCHRGGVHRFGLRGRAIRRAASGRGAGGRRQGRQFRRGEKGDGWPAPRPTICPTSAMRTSARRPISGQAPSPAITTASASIRLEIGDGAFIGSNTALVAPVRSRRRGDRRRRVGDHQRRRRRRTGGWRAASRRARRRAALPQTAERKSDAAE